MESDIEGKALSELLEVIRCRGITSYFGRDENNDKIHNGCLKLEKQQLIYRHFERDDYIAWLPTKVAIGDIKLWIKQYLIEQLI